MVAASGRMALSQPALSHKLNKMRREFGDPLFVRAARGLTPTPLAIRLAPGILTLVADLEGFYQTASQRDFLDQEDTVRIFTTDLIEQLLLPRLLARVQESAPRLTLITANTRGQFPRRELESGQCDMAIAGFYRDLPTNAYQQGLCEQKFTVLARRDHPQLRDGLDVESYLACPHIVTTLTGDLQGLVDQRLEEMGRRRRVVAGISSFLAPASAVAESDCLLTCLEPLADIALAQDERLTRHPCPIELPTIQFTQIWHQRTHTDPVRQWLRGQIKSVFEEAGQA